MSKKAGRKDSAVIQNENIALVQMSGKIGEQIVLDRAGLPVEHQHPRGAAIGERLLRNQFRRKMEIEVGDEHGG
jgi:hypothetical protein